jgi:carbamoyltransferase
MKVLGLHKDPWHNTGASIITETNGVVSFANLAEERLDRKKDSRRFPLLSTMACMKELGIDNFSDFDAVVIDYIVDKNDFRNDSHKVAASQYNFLNDIDPAKIHIVNHHLAHAYSVFYSSKFEKSAILIVDGRGSNKETQSLFIADRENGIKLIESTDKIGIGLLYASMTIKIGFTILQEGKTMGLAPYGQNINKAFFNFPKTYEGVCTDYSSICVENSYDMTIEHPTIETFEDKARVAFEVQEECEKVMLHLAQYAKDKTGLDNLCISGGVALNSVANYKVLQSGIFKDVFINPAASDTGISLGAALYGYHTILKQPKTYYEISPYLGPTYDDENIKKAIKKYKGFKLIDTSAFEKAAELIAQNKILGFFHGRSEMGPRALGNRSIVMSPLLAENKDTLNLRVKFREEFRPFAPSILREFAEDYYVIDRESPYMLFVPLVREDKKDIIKAVTHVDGTGRLQTVTKEFNGKYYDLIESFYRATGVPVLLNTSFNVAGEPIVETPEDAIKCFLKTDIDALLIEDYLLIKN